MINLVTVNVREKLVKYNTEIDSIIASLTSLKLDEATKDFDVRKLQSMQQEFTVLNSTKNRKKVENAFEDFYNEYSYELQKWCENNK